MHDIKLVITCLSIDSIFFVKAKDLSWTVLWYAEIDKIVKKFSPKSACAIHQHGQIVEAYLGGFLFFADSLILSQTTNFRPFQTERVCRRQFQIWWKRPKVFQKGRKHCGKRRNCSLWAISPFSTLFSKDLLQAHKNQGLFGKGITHSHTITPFDAPGKQAFWKHCL